MAGINALLFDPPSFILDAEILQQIISLALTASQSTDVSTLCYKSFIIGFYFGGWHLGPRQSYDQ